MQDPEDPKDISVNLPEVMAGVVAVEELQKALDRIHAKQDAKLAALLYLVERVARAQGYSPLQVVELLCQAWARGDQLGQPGQTQ